MKPYKLIAFDIDGTILDSNEQICQRLIRVVGYLKQQNYEFVLVTARFPLSVFKFAKVFDADIGLITLNGSLIINWQQEVIYSKTFPLMQVKSSLDKLQKTTAINYYHKFKWILENNSRFTDAELAVLHDITDFTKYTIPKRVNKITLIGETADLMNAQKLLLAESDSLIVSFSHPQNLEISCKTISKFTGLKYYALKKNIVPEQIIAFGDGENDIPMLSAVGLGVAMQNANPNVIQAAKDVAGYHHMEGVARYLEQLIARGIL